MDEAINYLQLDQKQPNCFIFLLGLYDGKRLQIGNSLILGLDGNDSITRPGYEDRVNGGAGNDMIGGSGGNDRIYGGGTGTDNVECRADLSIIDTGSGGDSILTIHTGNSRVHCGDGNDGFRGATVGRDLVWDGTGNDNIYITRGAVFADATSPDSDVYSVMTHPAARTLAALNYSAALNAISIDVIAQQALGAEIGTDKVSGFSKIILGAGNDTVRAGALKSRDH